MVRSISNHIPNPPSTYSPDTSMKITLAQTGSTPAEDPARERCLRVAAHSGALADEAEFIHFIEHGAAQLTPRTIAQLVCEMPEINESLPELDAAGLPQARVQLAFLSEIVEGFVMQNPLYADVPYRVALEAAFALQYFHRAVDLVPDWLGPIGFLDDAAVAAAVLARHVDCFKKLACDLRRDWAAISPDLPAAS